MGMRGLGRLLFAMGMIGLGTLSLAHGAYSLQWQPVPEGFPPSLAYVSGAILVLAGLGLLISRAAMGSAALLAVFLALWLFGLHAPAAISASMTTHDWKSLSGIWLPYAEILALVCGAWTLMALGDQDYNAASSAFLTDARALRITQTLFGLACLVFGAAHFAYPEFTADMIPDFVPYPLALAYVTGAGHVLAGLALISGIASRLAAILEALMMSLFIALVHVPMVLAEQIAENVRLDLTMLCIACALAGSAWAVAGGTGRPAVQPEAG